MNKAGKSTARDTINRYKYKHTTKKKWNIKNFNILLNEFGRIFQAIKHNTVPPNDLMYLFQWGGIQKKNI